MQKRFALLKEPGFLLLVLVISVGLWVHLSYVQYPRCLNLCDPSIHLGALMSSYVGNTPYEDPRLVGAYAVYPWTGMFLFAKFVKLLGLDPIHIFVFYGWLLTSAALLLIYFAARLLGISKSALCLVVFFESLLMIRNGTWGIFGPFYSGITHFLTFALLAFSFAVYTRRRNLGLLCLIVSFFIGSQFHFVNAIFSAAVLPVFFGLYYLAKRKVIILFDLLISFAYAVVSIAPTIWTWWLNGFHFRNPYINLVGYFIPLKSFLPYLFENWLSGIFVVFLVISAAQYFLMDKFQLKKSLHDIVVFSLLIASIILGFHHLISVPLFGFHVISYRFFNSFFHYSIPLFAGVSLTRFKTLFFVDRLDWRIIFAVLVAFLMPFVGYQITYDKEIRHGLGENFWEFTTAGMQEVTNFVFENTAPDETIATTYALGSVINSLTGRKQIAAHFEHSNVFADSDKRSLDLALLFYSNNSKTVMNISNAYGVRYALLQGEYGGQYQTSPAYEKIILQNNLPYFRKNFNYGGCLERNQCRDVKIIQISGFVSPAFLSVFNERTTLSMNGEAVTVFKRGIPALPLARRGNPFKYYSGLIKLI